MKIRLLILSLFASSLVFADDIKQLAPTVVTATRIETNSFDLPVSIDVVEKEKIKDANLGMNLSESLIRVPGITAQTRTSYAQDPQISTRGFGSRSAFGVRGVRVLVDGITLSMPDGIAQPGNVDLDTAKSIEVMRGPFSALYGSSSGGVIQIRTDDAPLNTELGSSLMYGSYGTNKESIKVQVIPDHIYRATLPIRIFNENLFVKFFKKNNYLLKNNSFKSEMVDNIEFKNFLFKLKEK